MTQLTCKSFNFVSNRFFYVHLIWSFQSLILKMPYLPKIDEPLKEKIYFLDSYMRHEKWRHCLQLHQQYIFVWSKQVKIENIRDYFTFCSQKVLKDINLFFPNIEFSWGMSPKGFLLSVSPIESKCTESKETRLIIVRVR